MYTRTNWVARVGTALNRFLKTNETSTEVELTNDPTGVTTAGTPFTVANMNKIEDGIYDAHVVLDNNINQDVKTTASPTFANATIAGHNIDSELDTLNGRVNQGVRTTDSPTFASVNTGFGANEVFKVSRETIDFGAVNSDTNKYISSMISGEVRFVNITASLTGNGDVLAKINVKLPSVGTYDVVSVGGALASESLVYSEQTLSAPKTVNACILVRRI